MLAQHIYIYIYIHMDVYIHICVCEASLVCYIWLICFVRMRTGWGDYDNDLIEEVFTYPENAGPRDEGYVCPPEKQVANISKR